MSSSKPLKEVLVNFINLEFRHCRTLEVPLL